MVWMPPQWVRDRAFYRFERIEPARTALIVIDLQRGFVDPGYPLTIPDGIEIVSRTNELARCVRSLGGHVIYTRHSQTSHGRGRLSDWQYGNPNVLLMECFDPDSYAHALHPAVNVQKVDLSFNKYRYSAFREADVDLEEHLRSHGLDTLIITGVATNVCCETTARDASMLGFKTFVASDCVATVSDEEHVASLTNLALIFADVRPSDSIQDLLREAANTA